MGHGKAWMECTKTWAVGKRGWAHCDTLQRRAAICHFPRLCEHVMCASYSAPPADLASLFVHL